METHTSVRSGNCCEQVAILRNSGINGNQIIAKIAVAMSLVSRYSSE